MAHVPVHLLLADADRRDRERAALMAEVDRVEARRAAVMKAVDGWGSAVGRCIRIHRAVSLHNRQAGRLNERLAASGENLRVDPVDARSVVAGVTALLVALDAVDARSPAPPEDADWSQWSGPDDGPVVYYVMRILQDCADAVLAADRDYGWFGVDAVLMGLGALTALALSMRDQRPSQGIGEHTRRIARQLRADVSAHIHRGSDRDRPALQEGTP